MTKKSHLHDVSIDNKKRNTLKVTADNLRFLKPLSLNQAKFFNTYNKSNFFILSGFPGTGKSFISLYKALEEVLSNETQCKKILIIRSSVPTRDLGFLPGTEEEKMLAYELPYIDICSKLLSKGDAYFRLKEQKYIQFESTSFLRSLTFDNTIVILDEFQNCDFQELDTVITRIGNNSKLILCGDKYQTDLRKKNECSGYDKFLNIVKRMQGIKHIEFNNPEDICRSDFVKQYILAKIDSENEA